MFNPGDHVTIEQDRELWKKLFDTDTDGTTTIVTSKKYGYHFTKLYNGVIVGTSVLHDDIYTVTFDCSAVPILDGKVTLDVPSQYLSLKEHNLIANSTDEFSLVKINISDEDEHDLIKMYVNNNYSPAAKHTFNDVLQNDSVGTALYYATLNEVILQALIAECNSSI